MKLFGSPTSPYVRKCLVTAAELGLSELLTFVEAAAASDEVNAVNPLNKVPALVTDSGESLFDSRMIMRYMNERAGGNLYPTGDWVMVRRESQAEGMIDALLLLRMEGAVRPEEFRWEGWVEIQSKKINNVLTVAEGEISQLERLDAASIGMACGLGYMDFRFPDWGWREGRSGLAAWFERVMQRASFQGTKHG